MNDGIFGYSLLFELIVVYIILNQLYGKTLNRWGYALAVLLIISFLLNLNAGEWGSLFAGDWSFILAPVANWFQ